MNRTPPQGNLQEQLLKKELCTNIEKPFVAAYAKPKTIISNFESGSGWGAGEADTTNVMYGTQGLKLTSTNAAVAQMDLTVSLDLTDKLIFINFYIDNVTNLASLTFYCATTGWAQYLQGGLNADTGYNRYLKTGWNQLILGNANLSIANGALSDLANIVTLRLKVVSTAGTTVNVTFDNMHMITNPLTTALITFTFDDGYAGTFTDAKPVLSNYNFPAVLYPTFNNVGLSGKVTTAQLNTLRDMGWDIGSHLSTADVTLLTSVDPETELVNTIANLKNNGLGESAKHFAYPSGAYDATTFTLVKKYHTTARINIARTTLRYATPDTIPPSDPHKLWSFPWGSTETEANIKLAIDNAVTCKQWVILMLHDDFDRPLFTTIVDYVATLVAAGTARVVTITEALKIVS